MVFNMSRSIRVASKRVRHHLLERLEDRRLLAGDVCFPLSPEQNTSQPAVAAAQATEAYGPVQSQSSAVAGPESTDGTVAPIVSIFSTPASSTPKVTH